MSEQMVVVQYTATPAQAEILADIVLVKVFLTAARQAEGGVFNQTNNTMQVAFPRDEFVRLVAEGGIFSSNIIAAFERADQRMKDFDSTRLGVWPRLRDAFIQHNMFMGGRYDHPLAFSRESVESPLQGRLTVSVQRYGPAQKP